jgi:anti-sigma factor RsiW
MDCHEFASAMHQWLDGEAPEGMRQAVAAHAAECGPCAEALTDLQRLREALAAPVDEGLPDAVRLRVMGALLAAAEARSEPPEVLTLPEAAAYLRATQAAVLDLLAELPHFRVAGEVRIRRASLERWIAREEAHSAPDRLGAPVLTLYSGADTPGLLAG